MISHTDILTIFLIDVANQLTCKTKYVLNIQYRVIRTKFAVFHLIFTFCLEKLSSIELRIDMLPQEL